MLFIGNGPSQVLRNAVFLFFLHFFPLMERGQRAKRLRIRDAPHRRSFSFCPSSCSSRRLAVAQRRPESIRPTISVFFFCPIDQLGVASSFSIKKKKKGRQNQVFGIQIDRLVVARPPSPKRLWLSICSVSIQSSRPPKCPLETSRSLVLGDVMETR